MAFNTSESTNTIQVPHENQSGYQTAGPKSAESLPAMFPTTGFSLPSFNTAQLTPEMAQRLISAIYHLYTNILKTNKQTSDLYKQHGIIWKNPALFKTSICDSWKNGQNCKYGSRCWYAHGAEELRYVPRLDQIPSLLESLSSLPTSLSQIPVCDLPLEFYQTVPPPMLLMPPSVSPMLPPNPVILNGGGTFVKVAPNLLSPVYPPTTAHVGTYTNEAEVQGLSSVAETSSENLVFNYPSQVDFPPANFNSSAIANFKRKVQEAIAGANSSDVKSETDELDSLIRNKSDRNSSGSSSFFAEDNNPPRETFMKSFHPFGHSYPLFKLF